jgi:uncharacterized membrane protein YedE/YeeE
LKNFLSALIAGALFGAGLVVSGLSNPEKVLAFLDVTGNWDPSLLVVMAVGVIVTAIGYRVVTRRSQPLFEAKFYIPDATALTPQLLIGAVLFGTGWGIAGFCPGPAVSGLVFGAIEPWWFVGAMLIGFGWHRSISV